MIQQLRTWCKAEHGRQKELATRLEVSPQLVNDWISGHREVSLHEWLKIEAVTGKFQKEQTMIQTLILDDNIRVDDAGLPVTLSGAKTMLKTAQETVSFLQAEVARLKASGASGAPPASTPLPKPPSAPAPVTRTAMARQNDGKQDDTLRGATPGAPLPIAGGERPLSIALGKDLDSPEKILAAIAQMSTPTLRACLRGTSKTELEKMQQTLLYRALKSRENITGGSVTPDP